MRRKSFTLYFINHEVNIHYSAFFNILFIAPYIGSFLSLISAFAALLVIVIVHELGHAYYAGKFGCRVLTIDVFFGGGYCSHEAPRYRTEEYIIAWGGILFQLALFAVSLIAWLIIYYFNLLSNHSYIIDALDVLLGFNLFIMVINLIPIRGLDGYKAWRLMPDLLLYIKMRLQRKPKKKVKIRISLKHKVKSKSDKIDL